jgi:hypothetical protein
MDRVLSNYLLQSVSRREHTTIEKTYTSFQTPMETHRSCVPLYLIYINRATEQTDHWAYYAILLGLGVSWLA